MKSRCQTKHELLGRIAACMQLLVFCFLAIVICSQDLFAQKHKSFNRFNAGPMLGLTSSHSMVIIYQVLTSWQFLQVLEHGKFYKKGRVGYRNIFHSKG